MDKTDTGLSSRFRMTVMASIALVFVVAVWAATGRLDVVSVSLGEVVPATSVKQIQHLEGGIVAKILVEEGQIVAKNQPIIELEPVKSRTELETIRKQIAALRVDQFRLEAEVSGQSELGQISLGDDADSELLRQSGSLFHARLNNKNSEIKVLTTRVRQLEATGAEVDARLLMNQNITRQVVEQIGISEKLLRQDLTNRMRHIELLRQLEEIKGKIATDAAMATRVKHMIAEALASIEQIGTDFVAKAQEDLDRTQRDISSYTEQLERYEDSLERTVLKAPEEGVIKTLYTVTEGGIVKPGGTIADLVPKGDRLVVEAKLPIQDIGYVALGDVAQLRLASSDAAQFSHITGKVTKISPDTIVTREGAAFYKVSIEPEQAFFRNGDVTYQLYPGMRIQCSILIGERTVLDYFLSPLSNFSANALGER